ncbi:MAG: hypothetical protein ACJ77M_06345 [Thermoleophilaceae bacterium]|jgi:hypothetical protein
MRLPWSRGRSAREPVVHVNDPRFDHWELVRDFEDTETARAWRQHLEEAGIDAVLTSDWPLDEFGRGDIALRVPRDLWSDAEDYLSDLDLD